MAKKKQQPAKKKKPPVGRGRQAKAAATVAPRHSRRAERSQALPGMEAVRSAPLDKLCEGIGDCRASMNAARNEEAGLIQSALQLMQRRSIVTYRHAKIELARVPGAEKLRVRVTKEEGDAGEGDLVPPDQDEQEGDRIPEGDDEAGQRASDVH